MGRREDRAADGKRPKPMPITDRRRLSSAWPFFVDPNVEALPGPGKDPSLADAVASIVSIAVERARSSGTFDTLREAVEAALHAAPDLTDRASPPCTTSWSCGQAPARPG